METHRALALSGEKKGLALSHTVLKPNQTRAITSKQHAGRSDGVSCMLEQQPREESKAPAVRAQGTRVLNSQSC